MRGILVISTCHTVFAIANIMHAPKTVILWKAREINRKQNPKETKNRKQIKQSSSRKIQKQSRKTFWLSDSLRWDQRIVIHLYFILNNTETIHRMWAHKCMCCSRSHHLGSCFVCWKLEKKKLLWNLVDENSLKESKKDWILWNGYCT